MTVTVRTTGPLKAAFGAGVLTVALPKGSTVDDLLASIVQTYGDQVSRFFAAPPEGSKYPWLRVLINGRDMTVLGGRQAVLSDGDDVTILTPVAGG